ncbi:glycerol-3-phosphate phosphatase-like isoform X3 [Periplaneta americana]|uniref:glycerol-3-phosphate phosphatase-like isoform X3 n=1 Tax=Periplaneta americana TaxID=6978 RepID=UPI0037E75E57
MAAVNLSSLSKGEFKEFIDSFDTVLADCDGVLWLGNIVIPGSPHAITELAKLGKNVFYVTNNSTKSREEYVSKFTNLGYPATKENILSTAYLAACYLQDLGFKKKVYVVGAKGITQELDAVGIKHLDVGPDPLDSDMNTLLAKEVHLDSEVGAVVVGFDEHISFPKMVKAASYLKQPDCIFVATNTDETFPTEFPLTVPGAGTFVKAIETCSKRTAFKIGKPSTYIGDAVVKKHKVNPKRTLMIGDKCSTDILFGNNCGFQTLLVLTGVNTLDDVNQLKKSNSEGHGQKIFVEYDILQTTCVQY